jgi:hypothetical protein
MIGAPRVDDEHVSRHAALIASAALLVFSALTSLALIGWLRQPDAVWGWKSVLAAGCALGAVATSALLWRIPSRPRAVVGSAIMLTSLARIGPPAEWTWASFALVAITFVLLMPLVHAAIILPDTQP